MSDVEPNGNGSGQRFSRYKVVSSPPPQLRGVHKAFERHMRKKHVIQNKNEARGIAAAEWQYNDVAKADELVRFLRNVEMLIDGPDGRMYYDAVQGQYILNCIDIGVEPDMPKASVTDRIAAILRVFEQPIGERPSDVDGIPAVQATVVEVLPCRVVGELVVAGEVDLQVLLPPKETAYDYTLCPADDLARLSVPGLRMHQEEIRAHLGRLAAYLEGAALVERESVERRMQEIKEERVRIDRESVEKMEEIDKVAKNQIATLEAEEAALIG